MTTIRACAACGEPCADWRTTCPSCLRDSRVPTPRAAGAQGRLTRFFLPVYKFFVPAGVLFGLYAANAKDIEERLLIACLVGASVGAGVVLLHAYFFLVGAVADAAAQRGHRRGDFLLFAALATPLSAFVVLFVIGLFRESPPRRLDVSVRAVDLPPERPPVPHRRVAPPLPTRARSALPLPRRRALRVLCPDCDATNEAEARFCLACGVSLE